MMASQGPSDLEAVDRALLPQVLQDTAWQLAFRQGSPQDAERMQALFGQAWVEDVAWRSDGMTTTRRVERPRVADRRMAEWSSPGRRVAAGCTGRLWLPPGTRQISLAGSETGDGNRLGNQAFRPPSPVSEWRNAAQPGAAERLATCTW